jgi:elongation factor Ts
MIPLRSPRRVSRVAGHAFRSFASSSPSFTKANIKLVAELRKRTEVSLSKAKEALTATSNDVDAALSWLEKDLVSSGAKKKEKVQDRTAGEGLIGVNILSDGSSKQNITGGVRGAMVELNCETDFVARNKLFSDLLDDIAHTAAVISDFDDYHTAWESRAFLDKFLLPAPLLSARDPLQRPTTDVGGAIDALIAKVGEKISLARAVSISYTRPPKSNGVPRLASYLHGSISGGLTSQGRIGTMALLVLTSPHLSTLMENPTFSEDLQKLQRSLARQIVGFDTRSVMGAGDETALYLQPFMMFGGSDQPVGEVLNQWAIEKGLTKPGEAREVTSSMMVLEFAKWSVGGGGVISSEGNKMPRTFVLHAQPK